jgi:hypothetical protein
VTVVRLFVWNIAESQTTIDELLEFVPELEPPSAWIWNEASERFGVIVSGDDLPEAIGWAQDLVGSEPDVYEEFDSA